MSVLCSRACSRADCSFRGNREASSSICKQPVTARHKGGKRQRWVEKTICGLKLAGEASQNDAPTHTCRMKRSVPRSTIKACKEGRTQGNETLSYTVHTFIYCDRNSFPSLKSFLNNVLILNSYRSTQSDSLESFWVQDCSGMWSDSVLIGLLISEEHALTSQPDYSARAIRETVWMRQRKTVAGFILPIPAQHLPCIVTKQLRVHVCLCVRACMCVCVCVCVS